MHVPPCLSLLELQGLLMCLHIGKAVDIETWHSISAATQRLHKQCRLRKAEDKAHGITQHAPFNNHAFMATCLISIPIESVQRRKA